MMEEQLIILGKVALSIVLGGVIGAEREAMKKPAGLRTHMMVAATATLLVSLADVMITNFTNENYANILRADPVRIVEAIIVGVSFIGAGTILKDRESKDIRFLTTSATILYTTAMGVAVGLNQFFLAAALSVLAWLIIRVLGTLEMRFFERKDLEEKDNT